MSLTIYRLSYYASVYSCNGLVERVLYAGRACLQSRNMIKRYRVTSRRPSGGSLRTNNLCIGCGECGGMSADCAVDRTADITTVLNNPYTDGGTVVSDRQYVHVEGTTVIHHCTRNFDYIKLVHKPCTTLNYQLYRRRWLLSTVNCRIQCLAASCFG